MISPVHFSNFAASTSNLRRRGFIPPSQFMTHYSFPKPIDIMEYENRARDIIPISDLCKIKP
ncbi:hypothetical protein II906_06660, partial [bacterium]|nr:hypothetical protein [bacterium]